MPLKNLNSKCSSLIILFIILQFSYPTNSQCHYSCSGCVSSPSPTNMYTKCTSCPNKQMKVLYTTPTAVNSTSQSIGLCSSQLSSKTNVAGTLLVIVLIMACSIIGSKQSIYLFYTLQNIALIGLVECGWRDGTGYILQSLQYLLIFNVIDRGSRAGNSVEFSKQYYYRLQTYFNKSTGITNVRIIGIINVIIVMFIILIPLYIYLRKKYCNNNSDEQHNIFQSQQNRSMKQKVPVKQQVDNNIISEQKLNNILTVLFTIFFLLMEQTALTLMTLVRFIKTQQMSNQILIGVLCCIYMIFLIYILVSLYFRPLSFFANKISMFINLWKKLLFPIFVIVPPQYHFLLLVLMIIVYVVEGAFDLKSGGQFDSCSRWMGYKICQGIILLFTLIYYLVQRFFNKQSSVITISGFTATIIIVFIISILAQIVIAVYQLVMKSKFQDRLPNQTLIRQKTDNKIIDNYTEEGLIEITRQRTNEIQKVPKYLDESQQGIQINNRLVDPSSKKKRIENTNLNELYQEQNNNNRSSQIRGSEIRGSENKNKIIKSRIPNNSLDQFNNQDIEIIDFNNKNKFIQQTKPNTINVREIENDQQNNNNNDNNDKKLIRQRKEQQNTNINGNKTNINKQYNNKKQYPQKANNNDEFKEQIKDNLTKGKMNNNKNKLSDEQEEQELPYVRKRVKKQPLPDAQLRKRYGIK